MNIFFWWHIQDFVLIFMDNILVYSKTFEEHEKHLRKVLKILKENKLHVKMNNCEFLYPK
jgi:hypothetical protein